MCMLIYVAARPWRLTVCRTVRQRLFVFFIPPSALLRSSEDSWSALKAAESNSSNHSKRYQGMMFSLRGVHRDRLTSFERDSLQVTEPLTRQTARRKPRWRDVEPHGHPAGALAPDQNTNQTLVMKPCKS